jgi:hypothetical protein
VWLLVIGISLIRWTPPPHAGKNRKRAFDMKPTNRLIAIVLLALVTVEFGGWSLLGLLTSQSSITPFQEQFFRAGHAHAGVLLVLALVYLILMDRTTLLPGRQRMWGQVLLAGIILQSGGFFLHMTVGEEGRASLGTLSTRIGAVLLAAALVMLAMGLFRAARTTPESPAA